MYSKYRPKLPLSLFHSITLLQELKARGLSAATEFSIGESRKPESGARNRFNDVLPCKISRFEFTLCLCDG